jgi:oligopeptidase A
MTKNIIQLDSNLDFLKIDPKKLKPSIEHFIKVVEDKVDEISNMSEDMITWENSMKELDNLEQEFSRVISMVSHLRSVTENDELDDVYKECMPLLVEHGSKVGQNKDFMNALKSLQNKNLNNVQKTILEKELISFQHSGIDLPKETQTELNKINQRLQVLSNQYRDNIMNSSSDYSMSLTKEELEGAPENFLKVFENFAQNEDSEGYIVKLIAPYNIEVMKYLTKRETRKKIHKATATSASTQLIPEYDNEVVLNEIVELKSKKSKILGYDNYLDFSLSKKMANSYEEIMDLLNQLKDKTKEKSKEEVKILTQYAFEKDGLEKLEAWDVSYYAESYKNEKYNINSEEIKKYFPMEKVKSGLFYLINKLYGVTFKLRKSDNLYHEDLYYYDLYKNNEKIASILMDLYARESKLGGAWMSDYQNRFEYKGKEDLPVAFIVCNFSKSMDDKPSVLSFDEVKTFFHEMGHALHHMLTEVNELGAAGISGVVWDAVELPSQFMEYFCIQPEILKEISEHIETKESINLDLLEKLKQEENYLNGMATMRQIELSMVDLAIHKADGVLPYDVLKEVREETSFMDTPEYDRFLNKFKHIFAGGYSAGYYSYKWADILSADIFQSFEENGIFCQETSSLFLNTILSQGGSGDISDMFVKFKGRNPNIDAYLKYNNLL